jgi:hypothetical protein
MGFMNLLTAGKKIPELKAILVGKYIFDNLKDENLKKRIMSLSDQRLKEGTSYGRSLDEEEPMVKYAFYAMAMMELNVEHGLGGFMWWQIKNPFMVRTYDESLWRTAQNDLKNEFNITVKM